MDFFFNFNYYILLNIYEFKLQTKHGIEELNKTLKSREGWGENNNNDKNPNKIFLWVEDGLTLLNWWKDMMIAV